MRNTFPPAWTRELPLSSPTLRAKPWQLVLALETEARCSAGPELKMLGKCRLEPERLGWDKGTFRLRLMSGAHLPTSPRFSSTGPRNVLTCLPVLCQALGCPPGFLSISPLLELYLHFLKQPFHQSSYNKHSTSASLTFSNSLTAKCDGGCGVRE